MNKQLDEILRRRGELLTLITDQREQLSGEAQLWQPRLELADKGLNAVRTLRSSPVLFASAAALLLFRRHGLAALLKGAWMMWQRYRRFVSLSSRL